MRSVLPLELTGPVTLAEVVGLRDELQMAIAMGRDLDLQVERTGPWDLAGLQLLISVWKSANDAGATPRLLGVPPGLRSIAERAGMGEWLRQAESATRPAPITSES